MTTLPISLDSFGDPDNSLNLERVIFKLNSIRRIEATLVFPTMKILDLSWNQIESLGNLFKKSGNGIKDLINIETIDLKKNKLTILKQTDSIWKDFENKDSRPKFLSYIDLRGNTIEIVIKKAKFDS